MTIKTNSLQTFALRLRVERRIEALVRELLDLPTEFTPDAYLRWQEIQNNLRGFYNLKRRFLDPVKPDELSEIEELLF